MTSTQVDKASIDINALSSFDMLFASTSREALFWNKYFASIQSKGLFGTVVQTPSSFIEGLWELYGDRRKKASELEKITCAHLALYKHTFTQLTVTKNLAVYVVKCAENGLGLANFDNALHAADCTKTTNYNDPLLKNLTTHECEFLNVVRTYENILTELGLIEDARMRKVLSENEAVRSTLPKSAYFLDDTPMKPVDEEFFTACNIRVAKKSVANEPLTQIDNSINLKFSFPAGRFATANAALQIIIDEITAHPHAHIALSSKNPYELFSSLNEALTHNQITAAAKSKKSFALTDFGSAYLLLKTIYSSDNDYDKSCLRNLLYNPFLGLKSSTVWKYDKLLRKDRLLTNDDALQGFLYGGKEGFPPEGLARLRLLNTLVDENDTPKFDEIEQRFWQFAQEGFTIPYIQEQCAALNALKSVYDAKQLLDFPNEEMINEVLDNLALSIAVTNYQTDEIADPQVTFLSLNQLALESPQSFDTTIVLDLTSEDYPLSNKVDAIDKVLLKLDCSPSESVLEKSRRLFRRVLSTPTQTLVLSRPLNDEDAEELYPSAMFEEFINTYRNKEDLATGDDIDNLYRIPDSLLRDYYEIGEDHLVANIHPRNTAQGEESNELNLAAAPKLTPGYVSKTWASAVALPYESQRVSKDSACPILSPSQIETYIACPYSWFALRRLKTQEIDETFGPREKGSFLHEVFCDVYAGEHYKAPTDELLNHPAYQHYDGFKKKITQSNKQEAYDYIFGKDGNSGVFARALFRQSYKRPGSRLALLPNSSEEKEIVSLAQRIEEWIDFEAEFLTRFTPVEFEYQFEKVPHKTTYQDEMYTWFLKGIIDRIDMDDEGNVVVIDYKGSVNPAEYCSVRKPTPDQPSPYRKESKIQTLLYAQALQTLADSKEGLVFETKDGPRKVKQVAGALYVSYNKGNNVAGVYRTRYVSAQEIPHLLKPRESAAGENGALSWDERMEALNMFVGEAVSGIMNARVEPSPLTPAACKYCPVLDCLERN